MLHSLIRILFLSWDKSLPKSLTPPSAVEEASLSVFLSAFQLIILMYILEFESIHWIQR